MFSNLIKLKGILDSAVVRGGVKVFHRLSNRGFYSPNLIWLQPLLSAQYLTAEINNEFSGYGTIPWGARELVPLITIELLLLRFVVIGIYIYSRFGFAFPT